MNNSPHVKLGVVAVSRECCPIELSKKRRADVVAACAKKNTAVTEIQTVIFAFGSGLWITFFLPVNREQ